MFSKYFEQFSVSTERDQTSSRSLFRHTEFRICFAFREVTFLRFLLHVKNTESVLLTLVMKQMLLLRVSWNSLWNKRKSKKCRIYHESWCCFETEWENWCLCRHGGTRFVKKRNSFPKSLDWGVKAWCRFDFDQVWRTQSQQ